jgi:hypothetical protein
MKTIIFQHDGVTLYAYVLIAIGFFIRYHIGRRRFNRRNVAGMQVFNSYRQAVLVTFGERLLIFLATLLIYGGCFLRLITAYNFFTYQ